VAQQNDSAVIRLGLGSRRNADPNEDDCVVAVGYDCQTSTAADGGSGTVGGVARSAADLPSDPAVVVLNPDDEVTPESFAAWLDRRQVGEPVDPGVSAAETLAEARAVGEV
jgi:hypothetical protein